MLLPSVHLNGTSVKTLIDDCKQAADAARALEVSLRAMSPNARDYYPQGDGAFLRARAEHLARIEKVSSVTKDLAEMYEYLLNEQAKKERK